MKCRSRIRRPDRRAGPPCRCQACGDTLPKACKGPSHLADGTRARTSNSVRVLRRRRCAHARRLRRRRRRQRQAQRASARRSPASRSSRTPRRYFEANRRLRRSSIATTSFAGATTPAREFATPRRSAIAAPASWRRRCASRSWRPQSSCFFQIGDGAIILGNRRRCTASFSGRNRANTPTRPTF